MNGTAMHKEHHLQDILASLRRLAARGPFLQMAMLLALYLLTILTINGFWGWPGIRSVLVLASFLGIAAAGQTVVILIGGIDLSVPSFIAAANLVTALLSGRGWSFGVVLMLVLGGAAVLGGLNGYLTHHFRAPAIIVTLGMGALAQGVALGFTKNGSPTGNVPRWLGTFSSPIGHVGTVAIPPVIVFWAVVAVIFGVVLALTVTGRRIYATGANERAADLALVRTERIWIGSFAVSAVCSAIVGVLLTGFSGAGDPTVGDQYLFTSLAAVLVGGTSLAGARGDYSRTLLGALIITLLNTLLIGHNYDFATQEIVIGAVIFLVVGVYGRDRRLQDRI